jgi:hypothetical protein
MSAMPIKSKTPDVWQMRTPSSRRTACGDAFPVHERCAVYFPVAIFWNSRVGTDVATPVDMRVYAARTNGSLA